MLIHSIEGLSLMIIPIPRAKPQGEEGLFNDNPKTAWINYFIFCIWNSEFFCV